MGVQRVHDVMLIRHAYVRTRSQSRGIGGRLLGRAGFTDEQSWIGVGLGTNFPVRPYWLSPP